MQKIKEFRVKHPNFHLVGIFAEELGKFHTCILGSARASKLRRFLHHRLACNGEVERKMGSQSFCAVYQPVVLTGDKFFL